MHLTVALALTLTRCDWNEPGVVARTLERLRRALGFVDELARRAAALGALQGAVLQALLAWLAKEQQRLDEARRLAEPSEAGAEGHADPAEVAPSEVVRQTLSSADGIDSSMSIGICISSSISCRALLCASATMAAIAPHGAGAGGQE